MRTRSQKIKPGSVLGQWTVRAHIAPGGNSNVWEAIGSDQSTVAIKVPKFPRRNSANVYSRFRNEIYALTQLKGHPGILPILDSHTPELTTGSDAPWLVTPIAIPLMHVLGRDASLAKMVKAVYDISVALTQVHELGFAHRDIKPENLFFYDGAWCVGDFGLVAINEEHDQTLDGNRLGPIFYIAPEMLNEASRYDGKKADVYSLAKLLWKLGTGQTYPLPGTLEQRVPALRLSSYTSDKRALELDGLLERSTTLDVDTRPTMAGFSRELELWLKPRAEMKDIQSIQELGRRIVHLTGEFRARSEAATERWNRCRAAQLRVLTPFAGIFANISQTLEKNGLKQVEPPKVGIYPEFLEAFSKSSSEDLSSIRSDTQIRQGLKVRMSLYKPSFNTVLNLGVDVCQRSITTGDATFPQWEDPSY